MKKNVCYYLMMVASGMGQELTPAEQKILNAYLRDK